MKTQIYVNRHVIARNKRDGTQLPPLVIRTHRSTRRASSVRIHGASKLVYSPDKPLKNGPTVWIETDGIVD